MLGRAGLLSLVVWKIVYAADAPPVKTVCELVSAPASEHGDVLVVGKISKHGDERRIEEDTCDSTGRVRYLSVRLDHDNGPLPPPDFTIPAEVVRSKFREISQRTSLHQFRFGSGDYEQWAIVFGRVEPDPDPAKGSTIQIICRSDSLIFLWDTPAR